MSFACAIYLEVSDGSLWVYGSKASISVRDIMFITDGRGRTESCLDGYQCLALLEWLEDYATDRLWTTHPSGCLEYWTFQRSVCLLGQ